MKQEHRGFTEEGEKKFLVRTSNVSANHKTEKESTVETMKSLLK